MNKNSVFIVAELSANHNNNFKLTVDTIKEMAVAGADAVKVQTYKPESLTLKLKTGCFAPHKEGLWKGYTPWELYEKAAMPYKWQPKLKEIANDLGLKFFSSPFDFEAVDFLETLNLPMYKIASFEITDIPLIEYIALKGRPVIISTGIADLNDIQLAVDTCRKAGNKDITLLKCTSQYPATIQEANLLTIPDMKQRFGVNVGVSDHTMGSIVPIVAVTLGAKIVEKHFILDRKLGGPDAAFSMEPLDFKAMVKAIRDTESALGEITYQVSVKDKERRRSLFIVENTKQGDIISEENVRSIRPGLGLHPKYYSEIIGKKVKKDMKPGTPLTWDYIE